MKIRELIKELEKVEEEHGNLEVGVDKKEDWHTRKRDSTNHSKEPILQIADKFYGF